MKNQILKYVLLTYFTATFTMPLLAQGNPDGGGDEPDPASIDNWMIILIVAGLILGGYFLIKNRQKFIA